jgi:ferredoxin
MLILSQDRCTVCAECPLAWKSFGVHPRELLGDMGQMEAHFGPFETVLILAQDRCTVCAKCTRAWKSFWPHPMELLGHVGPMEPHFSLFVDNVNLDMR